MATETEAKVLEAFELIINAFGDYRKATARMAKQLDAIANDLADARYDNDKLRKEVAYERERAEECVRKANS